MFFGSFSLSARVAGVDRPCLPVIPDIGGSILIGVRIIAVCDVFDALTNDRPYRKAWNREKVIDLIKEESGKKFDRKVVDVFLSAIVFAEETRQ